MPKRPCTQRAEWRLVPRKAAQRLSAHYQLDCDYGTPLIAIFKESDGNEPVYLCEAHVAELERPAAVVAAKDQLAAPLPAAKGYLPDAPQPGRREPAKQSRNTDDGNAPAAKEISIPAAANVAKLTRPSTPSRAPKDSLRARVRDLTYGDSAKALVDEAIWNLAPGDLDVYRSALQEGKPVIEAAQCAGGQVAVIVRKISEYNQALEALLAQSNALISILQVIHQPLERVLLDLIGNNEIREAQKDAAIERLGALEESLNRGLAAEITPLQALKIARGVGERANWGMSSDIPEELKPAYGAIYANLKNALGAAVPEAAGVFERLVNLYVAKAELETAHPTNLSHDDDLVGTTAHL